MPAPKHSVEHYLESSSFTKATKGVKRNGLTHFSEWLVPRGRSVMEADAPDVTAYLGELERSGVPLSSVSNRFFSLRGYFTWLEQQGAIERSPMAHMRSPTLVRGAPDVLSIEDLRALLSGARSDQTWALIAILAFNSLRISELLDCNVRHLQRRQGVTQLRFVSAMGRRRHPLVVLAPEVDEALGRSLSGRRSGPLFLNRNGERLHRHSAADQIRRAAVRGGLAYPVSPQMLSYTLFGAALDNGFTLSSLVKATGIPDSRHGERWLSLDQPLSMDNASLRLARLVLEPSDSTNNYLGRAETLLSDHASPEAFAVMAAGAILERHLRHLAEAKGVEPAAPPDLGAISKWAGELQRMRVLQTSDRLTVDAIGYLRNLAAHGWFDMLEVGSGERTYQQVRDLVAKYPLPTVQHKAE